MTTISNLPKDVLEIIMGYATHADVANLSLTCRELHRALLRMMSHLRKRYSFSGAVRHGKNLYIVDMNDIAMKYIRNNNDIDIFMLVCEEKMLSLIHI